jgi:AbrB family looped-hinge helix DNA binding protein
MKGSGMVRSIDPLGRIVIPKEVRCSLHIKPGDPFEIVVNEDSSIGLLRYRPLDDTLGLANTLQASVAECDNLGEDAKKAVQKKISAIIGVLKSSSVSKEARS